MVAGVPRVSTTSSKAAPFRETNPLLQASSRRSDTLGGSATLLVAYGVGPSGTFRGIPVRYVARLLTQAFDPTASGLPTCPIAVRRFGVWVTPALIRAPMGTPIPRQGLLSLKPSAGLYASTTFVQYIFTDAPAVGSLTST